MDINKRLSDLDEILEIYNEKLGSYQKEIAITANRATDFELKQRIKREVLPEIRQYQKEYWELLNQVAQSQPIDEDKAEIAIIEVIQEIDQIQSNPNLEFPNEIIQLLLEIRDKLQEPGQPAAAKAKLNLPIVPGFLSYELEVDTENSVKKVFEPIRKLFRRAAEKK